MGPVRIIILALALVAAIGLAVVVRGMVATKKPPVAVAAAKVPEIKLIKVIVATRDLPIGTHLAATDLRWQDWPEANFNPLFFTDGAKAAPAPKTTTEKVAAVATKAAEQVSGSAAMESLVGVIVHDPILAGEPITRAKLVPGGEGSYMSVVLPAGMQALGIPVKPENVAGGFILPNDHVDISQSKEVDSRDGQSRVRTTDVIVRNVRVLAVNTATKPAENANTIDGAATVTLEVTPEAALALVEAKAQGDLALALRSYNDVGPKSEVIRPRSRVARESAPPTVKIFNQNDATEVTVSQ